MRCKKCNNIRPDKFGNPNLSATYDLPESQWRDVGRFLNLWMHSNHIIECIDCNSCREAYIHVTKRFARLLILLGVKI